MASGAQRIKNGPASCGPRAFQRLISTLRACPNRSRARAERVSGAHVVRASVQLLWRLRAVHGSGGGGDVRGHMPAFARDRACRLARGGALPAGRTRGNDIASAGRFVLGSAGGTARATRQTGPGISQSGVRRTRATAPVRADWPTRPGRDRRHSAHGFPAALYGRPRLLIAPNGALGARRRGTAADAWTLQRAPGNLGEPEPRRTGWAAPGPGGIPGGARRFRAA